MSNLIFILKDGPFGDCTSRYELGFRTPMTVEEFIKEVLSQNERGCIYIDDRCINYSKDRVLSGQWEDIKDCEVFPISAGGGWGLMDYRVTIKTQVKELL